MELPSLSLTLEEKEEETDGVEYGGVLIRGGARAVDIAFTYILSFAVGIYVYIVLMVIDNGTGSNLAAVWESVSSKLTVRDYLFSALAAFGYQAICEGYHGSTIGKLVFGLVALNEQSLTPCSPTQAIKRTVALVIDFLFFGLVAAFIMNRDSEKQRLGDLWAGTVVVKNRSVPPTSLRSGYRFVVVLTFASAFAAICVGIMLIVQVKLGVASLAG